MGEEFGDRMNPPIREPGGKWLLVRHGDGSGGSRTTGLLAGGLGEGAYSEVMAMVVGIGD
jgi:hypothetical protein